jgi:hypothetical protein
MKNKTLYKSVFALLIGATLFSACKKDGNPNNLPDVDPKDYEGKVDGFNSSEEIFPQNLVAYWSFDENTNELKSNSAVTSASNATLIDGGVKGKALKLEAGYLYFAKQFDAFKTDALKSFTVSMWVQILNNGSKRTMAFQIANPGLLVGSFNFNLNTNSFPATNTDELKIQPVFRTLGGGTQDNVNTKRDNPGDANYFPYLTPKIGMTKWTHIVARYNGTTGFLNIWADGVNIGAFSSRGTGNNVFKAYEPSEVIIGANYNLIPGKEVNADVNYAAMTGNIDEIRIYNSPLPDAHIKALYSLGLANK